VLGLITLPNYFQGPRQTIVEWVRRCLGKSELMKREDTTMPSIDGIDGNRTFTSLVTTKRSCESLEKYPIELYSDVLTPNHWHLVLR